MKITSIGIDLAKEVFQIHGVDMHGKTVLHKWLPKRDGEYFANLESCLIGMLACGSSHYWVLLLQQFVEAIKSRYPHVFICDKYCCDTAYGFNICLHNLLSPMPRFVHKMCTCKHVNVLGNCRKTHVIAL